MPITIDLDTENPCKVSSDCHLLPCKIHHNGSSSVSKYFSPSIRKENAILTSSFRGFPLQGQIIDVPEGYYGAVISEKPYASDLDTDRKLKMTRTFNKITSWNWDKDPSADKLPKALEWVKIASALHAPIYTNNLEETTLHLKGKRKRSDSND